jgi:hypothetical protein
MFDSMFNNKNVDKHQQALVPSVWQGEKFTLAGESLPPMTLSHGIADEWLEDSKAMSPSSTSMQQL